MAGHVELRDRERARIYLWVRAELNNPLDNR
jgi:hypothetical protein